MATKKKAAKKGPTKSSYADFLIKKKGGAGPRGSSSSFLDPRTADGTVLGTVLSTSMWIGDVIASQTNLRRNAFVCPYDIIPLAIDFNNLAVAGGTPTARLQNVTDTTTVFAATNLTTAAGVRNSTPPTPAAGTTATIIPKNKNLEVQVTTAGGVTITGMWAVFTYMIAGVPDNRTL